MAHGTSYHKRKTKTAHVRDEKYRS